MELLYSNIKIVCYSGTGSAAMVAANFRERVCPLNYLYYNDTLYLTRREHLLMPRQMLLDLALYILYQCTDAS